jgi:hypothetical protein
VVVEQSPKGPVLQEDAMNGTVLVGTCMTDYRDDTHGIAELTINEIKAVRALLRSKNISTQCDMSSAIQVYVTWARKLAKPTQNKWVTQEMRFHELCGLNVNVSDKLSLIRYRHLEILHNDAFEWKTAIAFLSTGVFKEFMDHGIVEDINILNWLADYKRSCRFYRR